MSVGRNIAETAIRHRRAVVWVTAILPMVVLLLTILPTFYPIPFLNGIKVDVDPENMLSHDEPVRVFHNEMKKEFDLGEIVVVGVVNEKHPDGIFNVQSLARVYELTEFAKTLTWQEDGKTVGVIEADMFAPSVIDDIEQAGLGSVKFDWLMAEPPRTREEALAIRDKMRRQEMLRGTLLADDEKAIAIYLPLTDKKLGNKIYEALRGKIASFEGDERYHISGLPVVQDVFAMQIWTQLGIAAPASMMLICMLLFWFFRRMAIVLLPMIIANVSVVLTQGALVMLGYDIHLMSSEIPIFIMTIAVLDAIHILSDFFERYQTTRDTRKTIVEVMGHLFRPTLYVWLTTVEGFASLALTPLPPIQVFGMFVALGVTIAWILTMVLIPAYLSYLKPQKLAAFGARPVDSGGGDRSLLGRSLHAVNRFTFRYAKLILAATCVVVAVTGYGTRFLQINDNPTNWFTSSHPIRVADRELNEHFGGTYMAYLAMDATPTSYAPDDFVASLRQRAQQRARSVGQDVPGAQAALEAVVAMAGEIAPKARNQGEALAQLAERVQARRQQEAGAAAWDEAVQFVDEEQQRTHVFKRPDVLRYVEGLQKAMAGNELVGKTNSIVDLVKVVHRELQLGKQAQHRIPDTERGVAECLITYQGSHRPRDIWHYVTPDFQKANIWVQAKSGDNQDVKKVVDAASAYVAANEPPAGIQFRWFGLSYINVVWQEKIVGGIARSFLGSFFSVFVLVMIMFRSVRWGLLCMIPLTVTVVILYGAIGLLGFRYDAPTAVLSALSLGLAVDFGIHYLARSRDLRRQHDSWRATSDAVFGEPARAIFRNIIVIGAGFTPLMIAPLIPYKVTGALMALIMVLSGIATLLLLPAIVRVTERGLFTGLEGSRRTYAVPLMAALSTAVLMVFTLPEYVDLGVSMLAAIGVATFVVTTFIYRWVMNALPDY